MQRDREGAQGVGPLKNPNRTRAHQRLVNQIRLALGVRTDLVLWPISPSAPGSHHRTAPVGITDLIGILDIGVGVSIWIEVKTGAGKLDKAQAQFRDLVLSYHAVHIVARSVSDAINGINGVAK